MASPFLYDLILWVFRVCFDLFFRQIISRGAYKIPKSGPVIFVCAPHHNQFVDAMILMQQVRYVCGRRISFLIAEKSLRARYIGPLSRATGSIGVTRAQDLLKPATGKIYIKDSNYGNDLSDANDVLASAESSPEASLHIFGRGTKFTQECTVKGLIGLPGGLGSTQILEVISDEELTVRKAFKPKALSVLLEGTSFKSAPHIDQSQMYRKVFSHLHDGHCIGIFPEGGSHDRSDLLPLKAGVAIMALGALEGNPECGVKIVACGMNYFHPHKFRSRAVIEFGSPMQVDPKLVEMYSKGGDERRDAVKQVLDMISAGLKSVTVTTPDFDTLMVIQAVRRLYRPGKKRLPLPVQVDMTRRLVQGYIQFKDKPEIQHLRDAVQSYNQKLSALGIKDHQVEHVSALNPYISLGKLLYRSFKLLFLALLSLPGTILFSPIFIATKQISKRKAQAALKASTVKIKANDVVATWKVLVALGLSPIMYNLYALLGGYIARKKHWINPDSWKSFIWVVICGYIILPLLSYSALVIGETGMDIFKSLRPLALSLDPRRKEVLEDLKATRAGLVQEITVVINRYGPEMYSDFETRQRLLFGADSEDDDLKDVKRGRVKSTSASHTEHGQQEHSHERSHERTHERTHKNRDRSSSTASDSSLESNGLSRVGSSSDIGDIPVFSTYRSSSSTSLHSRVSSASSSSSLSDHLSTGDQGYSTGKAPSASEISKRIRGAMSEVQRSRQ